MVILPHSNVSLNAISDLFANNKQIEVLLPGLKVSRTATRQDLSDPDALRIRVLALESGERSYYCDATLILTRETVGFFGFHTSRVCHGREMQPCPGNGYYWQHEEITSVTTQPRLCRANSLTSPMGAKTPKNCSWIGQVDGVLYYRKAVQSLLNRDPGSVQDRNVWSRQDGGVVISTSVTNPKHGVLLPFHESWDAEHITYRGQECILVLSKAGVYLEDAETFRKKPIDPRQFWQPRYAEPVNY